MRTNDGLIYWSMYVSLRLNEFRISDICLEFDGMIEVSAWMSNYIPLLKVGVFNNS